MSTALKDLYNPSFYDTMCKALSKAIPDINLENFQNEIFTPVFQNAELKGWMTHTATVLKSYLSQDFSIACDQIMRTIEALKSFGVGENFEYMFFPEYIATNGINDFEVSVETLAKITSFTSAEFAVRRFILKYPTRMIKQHIKWTKHSDPKVRRLACEGARPRLPWAMALPQFKSDPTPVLPILETLKEDSDEWVRRSVSNHLNDISKDNPEIARKTAQRWYGHNPTLDAVVKHGCLTLFKVADPVILKLFGLDADKLDFVDCQLTQDIIQMGDRLAFGFEFQNTANYARTIRIEYIIHLLKKNGNLSEKIFKISDRNIKANERVVIERSHHFKPITTRVYYSGLHKVSIVLNGKRFKTLDFTLTV